MVPWRTVFLVDARGGTVVEGIGVLIDALAAGLLVTGGAAEASQVVMCGAIGSGASLSQGSCMASTDVEPAEADG